MDPAGAQKPEAGTREQEGARVPEFHPAGACTDQRSTNKRSKPSQREDGREGFNCWGQRLAKPSTAGEAAKMERAQDPGKTEYERDSNTARHHWRSRRQYDILKEWNGHASQVKQRGRDTNTVYQGWGSRPQYYSLRESNGHPPCEQGSARDTCACCQGWESRQIYTINWNENQ